MERSMPWSRTVGDTGAEFGNDLGFKHVHMHTHAAHIHTLATTVTRIAASLL